MVATTEQVIQSVYMAHARAQEKQQGKIVPSKANLDALTSYKRVIDAWAIRGRKLKPNTKELVNWAKASKMHVDALREYGGYSELTDNMLPSLKATVKAAPKYIKKDVKKAVTIVEPIITSGLTMGTMVIIAIAVIVVMIKLR